MAPAVEEETEEETAQREAEYQQRRKDYEEEQLRRVEERRLEQEREDAEYEARQAEREQLRTQRVATFERIIADAPEAFSAPQLRMLLRALVNLDPYTFTDDLAEETADENEKRSTEEVLLSVIDGTADGKLTAFALRLALSGHRGIPREGEPDFLSEAEAAFAPQEKKPKPQQAKTQRAKNAPSRHLLSQSTTEEEDSQKADRSLTPQREPAHRLPRTFLRRRKTDVPVQLQTQSLRTGEGQVRTPPRYNPERDGRGGIKGGCSTCFALYDLHQARLSLDSAHREFLRTSHSMDARKQAQQQDEGNVPYLPSPAL